MMTAPETRSRFLIEIRAPQIAFNITNMAFGTLLAENKRNKG